MSDTPTTRPSLLLRIRNADDDSAWTQFVEIYAMLIHRFAMRCGMQEADAADLTQDVLGSVASAIRRLDYEPTKGSFRSWLYTIVRNRVRNFFNRQGRHPRGSGDTAMLAVLEKQPAPGDDSDYWEQQYEKQLFRWAAEQIRGEFNEKHWQAFWQTAVDGRGGQEVANGLEMSLGALYAAKSRVVRRLKEKIQQIDDR